MLYSCIFLCHEPTKMMISLKASCIMHRPCSLGFCMRGYKHAPCIVNINRGRTEGESGCQIIKLKFGNSLCQVLLKWRLLPDRSCQSGLLITQVQLRKKKETASLQSVTLKSKKKKIIDKQAQRQNNIPIFIFIPLIKAPTFCSFHVRLERKGVGSFSASHSSCVY